MENDKQHSLFSKFMSFAFIAIGIFLGIYAFSTNATNWNVGTIEWDNSNYLSGLFRDASPTDDDIITALYGTGDDGSVYTQNWTGYNSGSCLNGGMSVVYTGNLTGGALNANTIYVVDSGTYDITTTIQMEECSALISSGDVIINGNVSGNNTIMALMRNNIIIENIEISGQDSQYGLGMHTVSNFLTHNFISHNNTDGGIYLGGNSFYGTLENIDTYDNGVGIYIDNVSNLFLSGAEIYNNDSDGGIFAEGNCIECDLNNVNMYNNSIGISSRFTGSTFTNIEIYETTSDGFNIQGDNNVFENIECYSGNNGIVLGGDNNILSGVQTHNNLHYGIRINQGDDNTLHNSDLNNNAVGLLIYSGSNNIITYNDFYENQNGLSLNNASNNNINNNNIYSNTQNGLSISLGSHYNTATDNNIYENNRGISFLNNCTYNTISGTNVYDNTLQGLTLNNTSNYNNIRNSFFSGNLEGISLSLSDNNTFVDIEANNNENSNISIGYSNNNTFIDITADGSLNAMGVYLNNANNNDFMGIYTYSNYYAGIHFYNSHNNTGTAIVSNSNEGGLYMESSTGNFIENATIENNTKNGVMFVSGSNDNILSGAIISGNMNHGIYMSNSNDNTFYDSTSQYNGYVGMVMELSDNNLVYNSYMNNNGISGLGIGIQHGIYVFQSSGNIINSSTLSNNLKGGIKIEESNFTTIQDSIIEDNEQGCGIGLRYSSYNNISGCILSDNPGGVNICISSGGNNTIQNTTSESTNSDLSISRSQGNNILSFLGNKFITERHQSGNLASNYYDSYTTTNNYIYGSTNYTFAQLTTTIGLGLTFLSAFDNLEVAYYPFEQHNLTLTGIETFLISGDNWDGLIYLPTPITAGTKLATVGETGTDSIAAFEETIEVISGDTYLTLNEGTGSIIYNLSSLLSGQQLKILKSTDGENREENTIDNECILDEYFQCRFETNGTFKLFAFGVPSGSFTGITETGAIVTSGGVYNTGITITFENPNLSGATLNGVAYTSGDVISDDDTYVFEMEDTFGNTTGMSFTIDTMGPICTGTTLGGDIIELMPSEILFVSMFLGFDTLNELERDRIFNTGLTLDYYDENLSGAMIANIADQDFTGEVLGDGDYIEDAGFYIIMLDDTLGNQSSYIFVIDYEDPTIDLEYPTDGLIINDNNNITFAFTGSDDTMIVGYTLYITGSQIYSGDVEEIDDNEEFMIHTVPLVNGDYTWHVIATDIAGNTGISDSNSFTIKSPLTGDAILSGSNVQYITGQGWYTKDYANISMRANDPINYTITGSDFSLATGNFIGSQIHNILLIGTDGRKDVFVTMTNSSGEYISKSFTLYLDTQAPVPMLITPASGATITTPLTLTWNAGPDNAGLSGYRYYVSTTNTFGTTIASGTTITPSVTLQSTQFSGPGTYYWYVVFVDKLGNLESSEVQSFYYSGNNIDTTPNTFSFANITGALLNRTYSSNNIIISGITPNTPVLASVNKGALYISGHFVGSTGYIQNGWTVSIELISSTEYEETVSSILTINGVSDTFSVTTKGDNEIYDDFEHTLSNTTKLIIISIFETLRDIYAGDKEVEFFNTFMVVLDNKIQEYSIHDPEYEPLNYLYTLIQAYYDGEFSSDTIEGTRWIKQGIYTAPNGKRYPITYDSSKQRFTSSNFVVPKYFPTLDTLKYIIDINNPAGSSYSNSKNILARWKNASIDGTRQSSPYTAPNKKAFYFFKTIAGKYSSYTFTSERYFDSLDATKEFIYNSNK